MKPILLAGAQALSPFRIDAIRAKMVAIDAALRDVAINARWIYALESKGGKALGEKTLDKVKLLLNVTGNDVKAQCYVTPRKGTISPWSSKATDIFHNCGLSEVARV